MRIFILAVLLAAVSAASAEETSGSGNPRFDEYYTVNESLNSSAPISLNPVEAVKELWESTGNFQSLKERIYSLIDFDHHDEEYGNVGEPYNRKKHFGSWMVDPRDNTCYNTRAKVLIRDSSVEVTFTRNGCTVASGDWADPYGGGNYSQASDIQVDHFVPLKNAYISGAYKWSPSKRCLYGNFLGNNFHLLPVYGMENNKKSDKTPEGYMPSDTSYNCQYLENWLKVKLIWSLGLTPPEKESVLELIRENQCELSQLTFSAQELEEQRRFMTDNMDLCQPGDH